MGILEKILLITYFPERLRLICIQFCKITLLITSTFSLINTFFILYLLDFVNFLQLSVLLSIRYALTSILDFPTGAISDIIGYKKVMSIAYIGHIIAVVLIIVYPFYRAFIIAVIIQSIASSQESGALQSWFDNQFNLFDAFDQDKVLYGEFIGRIEFLKGIIQTIAFVSGGTIATIFSRRILLTIHVFLLSMVLTLIQQLNRYKHEETLNLNRYIEQIKKSLLFLKGDPGLLTFTIGYALTVGMVISIWAGLILFPMYSMYGKTDFYTGLLRSLIFISSIIGTFFATKLVKYLTMQYKWTWIANMFKYTVYLSSIYLFFNLFPPLTIFDPWRYTGIILLNIALGVPYALSYLMMSKLLITIYPDQFRNTLYSLLPSLQSIFAIIGGLLGGFVIAHYNFSTGMLVCITLTTLGNLISGLGLSIMSGYNK